jgi:copper homeostasis protein
MHILLEVIVQSIEDARAAMEGGADRLEVVRAIEDGGLTPSIDLVHEIAAAVPLPLRVMVRENPGFRIGVGELNRLQQAARAFEDAGVHGIVLGFADPDGVRVTELKSVLAAASRVPVTFHRAFDSLKDPIGAIPAIAACPQVDRILTSGGSGSTAERVSRLRRYATAGSPRLTIVAGGRVDEDSLASFSRSGCVQEVHVGRAARGDGRSAGAVTARRVGVLRELLDR